MLSHRLSAALFLFISAVAYSAEIQQKLPGEGGDALQQRQKLGADLLQRGKIDQAIIELKKAIALEPESGAGHLLLGQAYLAQRSVSMVAEAKAEFQQALDLDPSLVWARFYLAKVYIDQGRLDKAEVELEHGLKERPGIPHFLSLLGEVNRKLGRAERSIQLQQQTLKIDPGMAPAHYFVALAYMDLKKDDDAIRELETALKSVYVAPEMYLTLGSLYARRKRYDEGEELCRKAIALDPSRPEGHLNLAQLYNIKGASDQALRELNLAVPEGKSFTSSPYYQQLQADVFFERGRAYWAKHLTPQAIRAYSTALEFNPDEGRTHRQLAEIYLRNGDYSHAFQHLTTAEKLGSTIETSLREEVLQGLNSAKPIVP
jgi:tetratricopeptide (TPR) repeat protein